MTDYFLEFYKGLDRQGPGDDKYTELAFRLLEELPSSPRILDIGCGTGKQSLVLAALTPCEITATDIYDCLLEKLKENARNQKLKGTIKTLNASMFDLPFEDEEFDVIWSEGAIYIMGFEKGLQEWKRFLKPGGYLAVSEISWIRKEIPDEIFSFWTTAYPEMNFVTDKIKAIENCGYRPIAHLTLPEYGWLENYYCQMESLRENFLGRFGHIEEARMIVENELDMEMNLYRKFKPYYSYVYYIMQKPA